MLSKTTKFFIFLFIFYVIYTLVAFIIALPDWWGAFKILLGQAPVLLTLLLIYLTLDDIEGRFSSMYSYTRSIETKTEQQEKQIKALLKTTEDLKKELKELKEQLENNEN